MDVLGEKDRFLRILPGEKAKNNNGKTVPKSMCSFPRDLFVLLGYVGRFLSIEVTLNEEPIWYSLIAHIYS